MKKRTKKKIKKILDIYNKNEYIDFSSNKRNISNDLNELDVKIKDKVNNNILRDGEWEIENIIDVTLEKPDIKESIIISADLANRVVKRGDIMYITAVLKRKDSPYYHHSKMGVIKVRVVEIYNTLQILNSLK